MLRRSPAPIVLLLVCFFLFCATALADDWKPIDPADLALKAPVVEKDAEAEAIFWEVHVADEVDSSMVRTVMNHYIRIKIFTERGKESQSKIDIEYLGSWSIKDIAARTVKADGTILEIKKDDVFERTIVKSNGRKIKAKSFAMPGVEPGAIIEYRWREVHNDDLANYVPLELQLDIPVQLVKYYIKPLSSPYFPYAMRVRSFQYHFDKLTKEKDGFYSISMANVPAFHDEPRMPPEKSVRPWLLIYYTEDRKLNSDQYWKEYGKQIYEENKPRMKVTDEVRAAGTKAMGDATTPADKLAKLFEFCRANIKNVRSDMSMTAEERAKVKANKTSGDTLKHGVGTGVDIDLLFAALATAAGFEARVVRLASREDVFLDKSFPDDYFLRTYDIAVKVGDNWLFYDPASTYVPQGMLRWQEEGQDALLSDPKEPVWIKTPLSPPEKSRQKRTARLRLSEDGTLEGNVRVEFQGHFGVDQKNLHDDESPAQREDSLRTLIKQRMSTAELSDIKIENVSDPVKPFVYQYHIRVAGYAQRTGKRIFIQPAFFEHGAGPLFSASDRKQAIYFHYPWSEEDEVIIDLPAGYALDNADAPAPFASLPISEYKPSIAVTTDGKTLVYKRAFFFGGNGTLMFTLQGYPKLKGFFDALHKEDNHTITLKQGAATAGSN
jgi:hypothetical protein